MDSNHLFKQESLNAIKEKIRSGELTRESMIERLETAVEAEQNKPAAEVNEDFIRSCLRLLHALHDAEPVESRQPHYAKEFDKEVKKHYQRKALRKRVGLTIGAVAAVFVLLVVGDGLLHREWLSGGSSIDGEDYRIEGHVFDPGLVTNSYAALVAKDPLMTTEIEEVVEWFGFTPPELPWVPDGWTVESYMIFPFQSHIEFDTFYTNTQAGTMTFRVLFFENPEGAAVEFEQVEHGESVPISGKDVYISENNNNVIAVWRDGLVTYSLDTPLGEQDLNQIIQNMIEKGVP